MKSGREDNPITPLSLSSPLVRFFSPEKRGYDYVALTHTCGVASFIKFDFSRFFR